MKNGLFILKTSDKELRCELLPEDVKLVRKALKGSRKTSFLDYFSLLISLFDRQPVENIPTEWGILYSWQVVGVKGVGKGPYYSISNPLFIKSYLKSRGFDIIVDDVEIHDDLFQEIIDKQKKKIGEEKYKASYRRLYEVIG